MAATSFSCRPRAAVADPRRPTPARLGGACARGGTFGRMRAIAHARPPRDLRVDVLEQPPVEPIVTELPAVEPVEQQPHLVVRVLDARLVERVQVRRLRPAEGLLVRPEERAHRGEALPELEALEPVAEEVEEEFAEEPVEAEFEAPEVVEKEVVGFEAEAEPVAEDIAEEAYEEFAEEQPEEEVFAAEAAEDELEVVGSGGITIIDPSDLKYSSMDKARRGDPVSLIGIKLHILVAGGRFDIASRDAFAQ